MNRPKRSAGLRGPLPTVRFPIRRTEVCGGEETEHVIEENTRVYCLHCGEPFLLNRDSVRRLRHPVDDVPHVLCPRCGYYAAIYYYYDRLPKRPRIQTPEDRKPRIQTPED